MVTVRLAALLFAVVLVNGAWEGALARADVKVIGTTRIGPPQGIRSRTFPP